MDMDIHLTYHCSIIVGWMWIDIHLVDLHGSKYAGGNSVTQLRHIGTAQELCRNLWFRR